MAKNHNALVADTEKYNNLVSDLNSRFQAVIDDFKNQHEAKLVALETDIQASTDTLEKLSSEQFEKMEAYISERSDKWHDTDSGTSFTEWKDDWGEFNSQITITPDFDCFNGMEISFDEAIEIPKFNR